MAATPWPYHNHADPLCAQNNGGNPWQQKEFFYENGKHKKNGFEGKHGNFAKVNWQHWESFSPSTTATMLVPNAHVVSLDQKIVHIDFFQGNLGKVSQHFCSVPVSCSLA